MKHLIFFALLSCIMTPAFADYCGVSKTNAELISTTDISELRVNVLAGYLDIQPGSGNNVNFSGRACTDEEQWLDWMTLDVERDDKTLELTVIIPYQDDDFDADYAYMDVDLTIPEGLPTIVKDSSGDLLVHAVSVSRIDDSSGNIRVSENRTSLEINDSSGSIEIRDLQGNLEVSDSSGDIDIRTVTGTVHIPRDSSGDIDIETVSGKVSVGSDGSGDIDIQDIGADVEIGSDGSGGIKIRNVKGGVLIGSDGSGSVYVADVSGKLLVEAKGSGGVRTRGIEGEISLPR